MKIAFIIYGSLDLITGGYIYDKYIVDYLKSKNCEIKVFTQPHVHLFGLIKNNFSNTLLHELKEFSPDLILQDQMNFVSLFLLNKKIKENLNIPIITIANALNSKTELFKHTKIYNFFMKNIIRWIEKNYLFTADAFIFNSYSTYKDVYRIIKRNTDYVIAYPGKDRLGLVNLEYKPKNGELKILFVGNLTYGKGLHLLLKALSKISNDDWTLCVAGDAFYDVPYSNKINSIIKKEQLAHKIKFLGCLNADTIKDEMLNHDVLVVPSYYESFGMVYVEAMSAGLPVIACMTGGVPEIIQHNINGLLIDPGSIDHLTRYLDQLIQDRKPLEQMRKAALTKYQKMLSWKESMQSVYSFLETQIPKKKSSQEVINLIL